MTNAFSSIQYPHWLILAGAILMLLGFAGLALRRRAVEDDLNDIASDEEPPAADPAPTQIADREAKLEQRKRDRWADRERGINEPVGGRPRIYDKESK